MNFLVLVSSRKICATLHAKLQSGSVSRSPNAKSKNIVRLTLFIVSAFAYCERTSNLHGSIDGFQFTPSGKNTEIFSKCDASVQKPVDYLLGLENISGKTNINMVLLNCRTR